jgi:hypothetical protein
MNRLKQKIIGSKRYADYMKRFHRSADGNDTNLRKIAQMIWYAQLASDFSLPIKVAGYGEEDDDLTVLIDDIHYSVVLEPLIVDE